MVESNFRKGKVALTVCCPLAEQFSAGKCSNNPIEWSWTACGHRDYIDCEGNCHCLVCGKSWFIQHVQFNCQSSSHGNAYVSYKRKDMIYVLSMGAKAILGLDADEEEALDFLENM